MVQHATPRKADPDIVIIDIDEASLARLSRVAGRWPWPRAVHAELVEGLGAQQPKAIVFDTLFSDVDVERRDSDQYFSEVLRRYENVYVPSIRLPAAGDSRGAALADVAAALGIERTANAEPKARLSILAPLALDLDVWRTGVINFVEDDDGVGRHYYLWIDAYGWRVPSLPGRVARDLGWQVPVGRDRILLDWRGRPPAYQHVSYADIFDDLSRAKRARPANEFTGKIVIIGSAATGLNDFRRTPLATLHPGVEILATALDNLKNGRELRRLSRGWSLLAGALLIIGIWLALQRYAPSTVAVGLIGATLLGLLATWGLVGGGRLFDWGAPIFVAWGLFLALALVVYRRERQKRERAVAMFGRMVAPSVVSQLVDEGATPESLSGLKREITVMFSDIRGFTSLSETRAPEEIVAILNRYFARQSAVILRHGGTLDKFIGDGIMAFWGAPLADAAHAQRAVHAALEMVEELQKFKVELGREGAEFADGFEVGIGLHSGPAVVGFIGSAQKSDFTAIGDTVNLASRVEGLTKGVARILVTDDTRNACGASFDFVERGTYRVKGRVQDTAVYEPNHKSS